MPSWVGLDVPFWAITWFCWARLAWDGGWCKADPPLAPLDTGGRFGVGRLNSAAPSAFPLGHRLVWGGLFCVPFAYPFKSPLVSMALPLDWALEITVEVDELEDVDDTDDEELVRWMVLRLNMVFPRWSSALIEFRVWPPLIHPGRLRFEKLGGFATAVIGDSVGNGQRVGVAAKE
jgi:hypothetical protein